MPVDTELKFFVCVIVGAMSPSVPPFPGMES